MKDFLKVMGLVAVFVVGLLLHIALGVAALERESVILGIVWLIYFSASFSGFIVFVDSIGKHAERRERESGR